MNCSFSKEKYGFLSCSRSLTVPNCSRNFRKPSVSGSFSAYSFMSEPSTHTLVWTDLRIRTLRHLTDRICCSAALVGGIEPRETYPDTSFSAVDTLMDERRAVEPGPRNDMVRPGKDESCFMVVDASDIERDNRKGRGIVVNRDARYSFQFPDEMPGESCSFTQSFQDQQYR